MTLGVLLMVLAFLYSVARYPIAFASEIVNLTAMLIRESAVIPPWMVREFAETHRCSNIASDQADLEDLRNLMTAGQPSVSQDNSKIQHIS